MSSTPNPGPRHDPPNIPPSTLCTTHAYHSPTRLRRLYYDTDPNKTPYLYITNVPPTLITQSLEQDRFVQTKALITYDYPSRTLIMKGHPRRQELAKEIFNSEFLMFRYGMGRWALVPHGSATVADGDVVKEPNLSWQPSGRSRKWPSLVFHVGWPEGREYLRGEARLWLEWSKGDVKAVVLMDVDKEGLGIEKWVVGEEGVRMEQRVEVRKVEEEDGDGGEMGLVVRGGPFVLTFREVFLREPDPEKEKEKDWVWGVDEIKESMGLVWRYGED
ncbi:hypothetical protein CBS147320_5893 [Aspergillus niger]|nr:hypothetical protein CBS147320_5893 [Aspergillus niger]